MKILSLQSEIFTNFPVPNRVNKESPTFGIANSGKLKTLFSYGLPCMYTGVEMIDPAKVQRLLNHNAFDKTAKEVIETLKPFEKSITDVELNVYNIIKKAAAIYPDKDLQQLLKILAPHYKAQLQSEQLPIIEELSQKAQELPDEYKYKFSQFMLETDDKINDRPVYIPFSSFEFRYKLDKIKANIAQTSPPKAIRVMNKLILEAAKFEDETNSQTIPTQKQVLRFLKIILKSSILKEDTQLRELFEESDKRLNGEKILVPFNRKSFIYDLVQLIELMEDKELQQQLLDVAVKLPASGNSTAAYILKFSREPSWKIGYRILWPNIASVEHILPKSKGGEDAMFNFGGAGTRINAQRGNIDFVEQLRRVPETKVNSQKYVNGLIGLLKRGIFNKTGVSSQYIDSFCKTIYDQSQGSVNLDISRLEEHRVKGNALLNILSSLQ